MTSGDFPGLVAAMVEVVCGLIEDGAGRVLACQRPPGKHLGGFWEFPGGKLEDGEGAAEALRRELQEELGVEVEVGHALLPVVWQYERGPIRLYPFRCRIRSGELVAHEHVALRWVTAEECEELDWAAADLPVLAEWKEALR